jgi:hypothetical protein
MRRLMQYIADGFLAGMIGLLMVALHYSLLSDLSAKAKQTSAPRYYRPVYTRSGRRNRIRF